MEEVTMNLVQIITSYGALGACTAYFMYKAFRKSAETDRVIAENTKAINEFSTALKLLTTMIGGHFNE